MITHKNESYNFYIVDRDQKDREFIQNAIKDTLPGANINCFSEGNDVMESLYRSYATPDLILLDLEKDKNFAKEALTMIKQSEFFFLIPVVALCKHLSSEDRTILSDIGIDACCRKPRSTKGMKSIIKKISSSLVRNRGVKYSHRLAV